MFIENLKGRKMFRVLEPYIAKFSRDEIIDVVLAIARNVNIFSNDPFPSFRLLVLHLQAGFISFSLVFFFVKS